MIRDECAFVDTWLDDWLAGRLSADAARRIATHVESCERCRRLADIVRDAADDRTLSVMTADADHDLLPGVMDRTSGSPCARAEQLLPDLVDGDLDADTRGVLADHLAHCDSCSTLLAALEESRQALPALVELVTPPGFVEGVLEATSRRERRSWLGEWWLRMLARPRASLELAYVATVLLVVFLGNPVSAFQHARNGAEQLVGRVPVSQIAEQLPASEAAGTVSRIASSVKLTLDAITNEMARRWAQSRELFDALRSTMRSAIDWLSSIDWKAAIGGAKQATPPPGRPAPVGQR